MNSRKCLRRLASSGTLSKKVHEHGLASTDSADNVNSARLFVGAVFPIAGPSFLTLMKRLWLMMLGIVVGTLAGTWPWPSRKVALI
ncbi:hypothetical protein BSZ19_14260 [Bradyrhizobium japonicum]|uniref:Uncharacterized protein n=1 Tax=Bradyrhizobium japonicum TaxID=375 RepID=A0A1Y2JSB8_BRAJP|nr:hypothetical protein BSZ19_14260 [Bradyrhizobium japonicum]